MQCDMVVVGDQGAGMASGSLSLDGGELQFRVRSGVDEPACPALEGSAFLALALRVAPCVVYARKVGVLDPSVSAIFGVDWLRVLLDMETERAVDPKRGRQAVDLEFGVAKC